MFKGQFIVVLALVALALASPQVPAHEEISAERMREHVARLASDELAGRAPGSEGEALTLDYLVSRFKELGYAPGNPNGTYLQEVPLRSLTVTNKPDIVLRHEGDTMTFPYQTESMAWTMRQREHVAIEDAELVFVGYGVVAPEYDWDDYKDVDVNGKIIVMLVNDPPHEDESLFGGRAMTYYGRWTYKYEIAAEKGAAGAIVIHTTEEAGYGWDVVANSWSGEQFDIIHEDDAMSRCKLEGWITEDAAVEVFEAAGRSFYDARDEAATRAFRPYSLGMTGSVQIDTEFRSLSSNNVVARLEGTDPESKHEHVIYTAHWDHLGVGKEVDGDNIYNGALDNASGVAGLLEVAAAFAAERDQLKRSVMFLMVTAEESGLLGAYHYADNPLYPLTDALAVINVDGLNVWGKTKDMVVVGYGQSNLETYLEEALAAQGRKILPDSEPEKGYYYRSDHFAFAKKGVPALYSDSGVEFVDRPEGWGMERRREYVRLHYHKPQDELEEWWNLAGAAEDMSALFAVGLAIVSSDDVYPAWHETSEFKGARAGQR